MFSRSSWRRPAPHRRLLLGAFIAAGICMTQAPVALASVPGDVVDFAGNGSMGAPVPGPATSSPVGPNSVATDSAGNVYIADVLNNEIEKVTPDGTLSIIAGTGTSGIPTPGLATSSQLNYPSGVATDSAGDVYIADANNNEIEKVTPAGMLSIIAGTGTPGPPTPGTATGSQLSSPYGVSVDIAGNVYIADYDNNQVEKVSPSGALSVIAGDGTQGVPTPGAATNSALNNPTAVTVDAQGNVYIADTYNNVVEKVDPSGTLTIVAGTGAGAAPTPGPATASALSTPQGVAVDAAGDLYIADYSNYDIEKVTPDGTLAVIAGNGVWALPTWGSPAASTSAGIPSGVAVDPSGNVFFTPGNGYVAEVFGNPPINSAAPQITGSSEVSQTLSASTGSWSPTPIAYSYQWQLCDASGANCAELTNATAATRALSPADTGHTLRVLVTAISPDGTGSATSPQSTVVTAAPTPTPTPGPNPTPTPGPKPPTKRPAVAVTVPDQVARIGLTASRTGWIKLALICPRTTTCNASGLLTIALPGLHLKPNAKAVPARQRALARFHSAQIARGHTRLLAVRLGAPVLRALQRRGIHRVRVTLFLDNHLHSGQAGRSIVHLWLRIPTAICTGDGDHDSDDRGAWCLASARARLAEPAIAHRL